MRNSRRNLGTSAKLLTLVVLIAATHVSMLEAQIATRKLPTGPIVRPLPNRPATSPMLATLAPCADKLVSAFGAPIRAGQKATVSLVSLSGGEGKKPVVVVGDQAIPVLRPGAGNEPRQIPPKAQKAIMSWDGVTVPDDPNAMTNGWFTQGRTFATITDIRNIGDGTAEINLPPARGALFDPAGYLSVSTDRCSIAGDMSVQPPVHYGRWFPPAFVSLCGTHATTQRFNGSVLTTDGGPSYFRQSALPIQGRSGKMVQYCTAYGGFHEGGTKAGNSSGVDRIILWPGKTGTDVQVLSECVTRVVRETAPLASFVGSLPPGHKVAATAMQQVIVMDVNWQIKAEHGFCYYAVWARGQHATSLPDQWRSATSASLSPDAERYTFSHDAQSSTLFVRKQDAQGRWTTEPFTIKMAGATR